jgi:predicted ATPase
VSFWALSEIVRGRLSIGEDDPEEVVAERLGAGLERWIADGADREFIAPRLGQLLGIRGAQVLSREDLFAGWRLFFERLSDHLPLVMVIEDLQWADAGLVGFLDHLLEWSADHALFLLVLSRPEGAHTDELRSSRRNVTTVPLDPLPDEAIGELLDGLVPGLPAGARSRIVERAEGVPLYAIETVRSLLDKGLLAREENDLLSVVGDIAALDDLDIPPGLMSLIASRLDGLSPAERGFVKECSVLGDSFARQAVEAVSDEGPAAVAQLLGSLVRKEILTVRADKLSPEKGQYAFTQSLIRSVAYGTLSRSERKARHRKVAEHLEAAFPDEGAEVKEVIAAHFYDAYRAAKDDRDAGELRLLAKDAYVQAAERSAFVGSPEGAESAYLRAAELTEDEPEQAELTHQAGKTAYRTGWYERAISHLERAIAAHVAAGRVVEAARATSDLSRSFSVLGRNEQVVAMVR